MFFNVMNLNTPLGTLCLFAASAVSVFASVDRTVEKSFSVQPGGTLRIDTSSGAIRVHSANSPVVKIVLAEKIDASSDADADAILKNMVLSMEQSGADVTAKAKVPRGEGHGWFGGWRQQVQLSWDVTVPDRYSVNLNTSGGSIGIGDLEGAVNANTSGGSIEIGSIKGTVRADTSGGHMSLAACTEEASLNTSGGSIHVGTAKGPTKLDTSGGSISVESAENTVLADTSGGSIHVTFVGALKGPCKLDTSGGSITAKLDATAAFNLVADTSAGGVNCEFPIEMKGHHSREHLEGSVNGGGPLLSLDTSAGTIRIEKR